ncbi:MAG TPA: peptide-methionine (S)-S-oxide reductase MsrA [Planococcus sp. (in: firmicutes)]|nr:peptide-methionine (S)-S-oxide reductase MsrA [Planococcus sp. (in: firmicutes)]
MTRNKPELAAAEQEMVEAYGDFETATFGMGCFWGPEARFGSLPGVLRTRVGYSGGTTWNPVYRQMGDHTETVQIDFDPAVLGYEEVLRHFWENHYPNRDEYKGRQYISLLRFHSVQQQETIAWIKEEMESRLGEKIETDIAPNGHFTLAEERHQKYYLKRYPRILEQLAPHYSNAEGLRDSVFAARLNGFAKGFGNREKLKEEIAVWNLSEESRELLTRILMAIKW